MGLLNFLKTPDINEGIKRFLETPDAVLLDVRNPQEYQQGHIPGSINLPLHRISSAAQVIPGKDIPLFVYCYSGARSSRAVILLSGMGYTAAENLGGISSYHGEVISQ